MQELIMAFMIVCGSFQPYMEEEINRSEQDLFRLCGTEAFMSQPEFVEFLNSADYTHVSDDIKTSFEDHLSTNRSYYYMVIEELGGADYMRRSTPDVIFEDLEDQN